MRPLRFLIALSCSLALLYLLGNKMGSAPPMGKFLNPFHGVWANAQLEDLENENWQLEGLEQAVSVRYDGRHVPHIEAATERDLYFMQGFITASDRLWQMDMQTRAAAGRLSEVLGADMLATDRYFRRIGMLTGAEATLGQMESVPANKTMLNAFTAGVNAYVAQLNYADYPVEFKLLDYAPEQWSPLKTSLLLKYMSLSLTGYEEDIELTNAYNLLGSEKFNQVFPSYLDRADPVIEQDTSYKAPKFIPAIPDTLIKNHGPLLRQRPWHIDKDNGSNNWAVAGSRTKSGYPILCNDPHLGLNLPSLWYEMQLTCPTLNVYGATLPGAPGTIIGFNEKVAWGLTNAQRDVKDWYYIDRLATGNKYRYEGRERPLTMVRETIKVRNEADYVDTIWYSHHGPIVYDKTYYGDSTKVNLAMRWIAHDASDELSTFYKLNRAETVEDYLAAMKTYTCPGQNIVFAAQSGDIAISQQGKFPIKWEGQGRMVGDGSEGKFEWSGFIDQSENPVMINPARGYVSSANQYVADETYPYYYNGNFEFYRNKRINAILDRAKQVTVQDMMDLQNDHHNQLAYEALPVMINLLDQATPLSSAEMKWRNRLVEWDYRATARSTEQVFFKRWWEAIEADTWDELDKEGQLPIVYPEEPMLLMAMKDSTLAWVFDRVATKQVIESKLDLIAASFSKIAAELADNESLTWGADKATFLQHLARIGAFNKVTPPIGGGRFIVNATKENHGPSWKMVVEMGTEIKAYGIYPGGQTGNVADSNYTAFVQDWAAGTYYELLFLKRGEQSAQITATHKFQP